MNGILDIIKKHLDEANQELEQFKFQRYLIDKSSGIYKSPSKGVCYVVGGGTTLQNFNFKLLTNKQVIVSNMSIFNLVHADYFVTTDYTFLNHLKTRGYYPKWKRMLCHKVFVANFISEAIQLINGCVVDTKYNLTYELEDFDEIIVCRSAKDIGYTWETFNSGYNSGFSSFQLAVIKGYNPIYLLGFDMNTSNNKTHYHAGYGKSVNKMQENLENYCKHFKYVLRKLKTERPDLKIISCSKISPFNEIVEYKPLEEIK